MEELIFTIITYVVYGLIGFLIIKFIFSASQKHFHSHWNTLIDNFNFSTKEFYHLLEEEFKSHGISNIIISEVKLKEGNMLSSKRLYLRMEWRDYQYDICGAPFGKGFFISWWLLYKGSILQVLIERIPIFGAWLSKILFPKTYYTIDTASMFMTYAQSSVLKVMDDMTKELGTRSLTENERKPVLQDIFKR